MCQCRSLKSSSSSRRRSARRETTLGTRRAAPTLKRSAPSLKPVERSALIAERVRRRVAGEPLKLAAKSERSPMPTVRRLRAPRKARKRAYSRAYATRVLGGSIAQPQLGDPVVGGVGVRERRLRDHGMRAEARAHAALAWRWSRGRVVLVGRRRFQRAASPSLVSFVEGASVAKNLG